MDLGTFGNYRLPAPIRDAYGVATAQELADQLGVTKQPSLALSTEAEDAYKALKRGDREPARTLLVDRLGVSASKADEALDKLPPL